ncbi:S-type pyocin domain-containing protein [Pseudomonas aeruginosa]|nr:S-type pyocin domain-containing protein [Pseudomonas aeruginosa]
MTWTPATPPGSQNPSSTTPVVPQPAPVYEGATITPVQAEPESYPGVPLDLDDLIVIFPAGSDVPPLYLVFSSRRLSRWKWTFMVILQEDLVMETILTICRLKVRWRRV